MRHHTDFEPETFFFTRGKKFEESTLALNLFTVDWMFTILSSARTFK